MAKKRDRKGLDNRSADRVFQSGVLDPRAFEQEGTSFAGMQGHQPIDGGLEAWEDEETAPDLFSGTSSAEDRMQASGGQTQRLDDEPKGQERPGVRRR
jgi:hypothetical protein